MSPTYQRSEPSPDNSGAFQAPAYQPPSPDTLAGQGPPDPAPPQCPSSGSPGPDPCAVPAPTTMMGQLMGALNPALLDDLNLNIEGGFDCNVDEVIKQELSLEGSLDFNFGQHAQHLQPLPQVRVQSGIETNSGRAGG